MKKFSSIISVAACAAVMTSVVPFASSAADSDVIYGTMNIPYADFYKAELEGAPNAYEVDAVSSATSTKVFKNGEGELFEGTYNETCDGTETNPAGNAIVGRILGVTYPVAITEADLAALGENNYGFTKLETAPDVYKTVTVADGQASFSEVNDADPQTAASSIKLSTTTAWGDYLIDVVDAPADLGAIYGALVTTAEGNKYAFRHEQNIWRGEIAWSSGIKTSEPHGNSLDFEDYESLMGSTITKVTFITLNGYVNINTDTYVPVKFASELTVEDTAAGTGSTTFSVDAPEDYAKTYEIGEGFEVTDGNISFTDQKPGTYTLNMTDGSGKYAPLSATFTLTTEDIPVKYEDGKLVAADGFSEEDAANFIKNISAVEVNGTKFSAAGKGAVKVFDETGAIDFAAAGRNGNVFDGSGEYSMNVTAAGYTNPLIFAITASAEAEEETTEAAATTSAATTAAATTAAATTTTAKATTTAAATTAKASNSPQTGVATAAAPLAALAAAGAAAFIFRKKND